MKNLFRRPTPRYEVRFIEHLGALCLRTARFRTLRATAAAVVRFREEIGQPFRVSEVPPCILQECGVPAIGSLEVCAVGADGLRQLVTTIEAHPVLETRFAFRTPDEARALCGGR